jgi:hypothetical protein
MVDAPRRLHMYTWQGAKPFITSNSAQLNFEPHPAKVVLTNTLTLKFNMVSNPIRQIATTTYKEGKYIRVKKDYMTFSSL